ncbi:hypothetical protein TNCV_262381 [Trichonephila clavipes]|nr:hypothetical protein TNCV_262381 [Trichonephila clavipes]
MKSERSATLAKQNAVHAYLQVLTICLHCCSDECRLCSVCVRLVLQNACLVRWFLTQNRKMNEQKINLKFCFKFGKTPKETQVMLIRVYELRALSMNCVYEWFVRFREGRESVSDNCLATS